jgi:4-hydroxy-2-oxoheptanedioate aldolase
MRPNRMRTLMSQGQAAIGTICTSASPLLAEALGYSGFDFLLIDLQHGENNLGNVQAMLHAVSATAATPLVRVPANTPMYVQRALDLGAYGVVVPMVNTPADAAAVVRSVRYAPVGERSWGPIRGALYGGSDYFAKAHEELLVIAMLETADGLRNAREIMSTPGVDACFIGPNDLSISLGFASELAELPPQVEEAIATILGAASACGKHAGIHTYAAQSANRRIGQGFRFVTVQSDVGMVRSTALGTLAAIRT